MWSKCTAMSTDDARVLVRVRNRVVALIKQVAPEVVNIHCIIHHKTLVAKKLVNEEYCQYEFVMSSAVGSQLVGSVVEWLKRRAYDQHGLG